LNQPLLSIKEVSSFLSVHPKTLYKWAYEGKIPFIRVNSLIRFNRHDIEVWQEKNKIKKIELFELLPRFDLSLEKYDKMLLKGRSVLGKNSKRWNYGFGAVYIRKTKQGKDRWYIDYRDENANRVQKVVKNAQKREDALIELQTKVAQCFTKEHPQFAKAEKIQFSKFAQMYLENYAKVNKRSWKDDFYRLQGFVEFFGTVLLHEVSPIDIEKFKSAKLEEGIAKSTVNRYLAILKRMFNIAIEWGYAKDNPVKRVKFYSEKDNLKERILTEVEEDRLLEASSEHLRPILVVALNTGMRRGEILNLKWEQVDLEAKEIRVESTKSGKSRIVDVNSLLSDELEKLKNESRDNQHVFLNPRTGKPYGKLQTSFEGACRRAGIKGLRFHDLRHTFASRLVERGVDLIRVKDLLGHSSVKVTERYTHANRGERKKAVELLCRRSPNEPKILENLLHSCDTEEGAKKSVIVSSLFSVN
jgi:excisionase family DNA binding protein